MVNETESKSTQLKEVVWRKLETTPTDGLYLWQNHEDRYNIQNKYHSGMGFPKYIYQVDKEYSKEIKNISQDEIFSVYIDRLPFKTSQHIFSMIGDYPLTKTQFQEVAKLVYDKKVSGARCVRFTNVSSGYPTYRFDFVTKGKDTPKWEMENPYKDFKNKELEEQTR